MIFLSFFSTFCTVAHNSHLVRPPRTVYNLARGAIRCVILLLSKDFLFAFTSRSYSLHLLSSYSETYLCTFLHGATSLRTFY